MPTVLLTVEARDQSSAVLQRVQQALEQVNQRMQQQGVTARQVLAATSQNETAYSRYAAAMSTVSQAYARLDSATARAAETSARYQAALGDASSKTSTIARLADQAASAADRQSQAEMKLAAAFQAQADAAGKAAAANKRVQDVTKAPLIDPMATGGGAGGHGSGMGGYASTIGKYYLAPALGYAAASQATQSLGRDITYSQTQTSTQAETGLTGEQTAKLSDALTKLANSGTQPYDRNTLLQGAYSEASLGIGMNAKDPGAALADLATIAAKVSAAAGAPDTASASNAIVSVLNDYGLNNKNVVQSGSTVADQLQVAVKLGAANMTQLASQVAVPAQMASSMGIGSGQILSLLTAESAGGIAPEQLGQGAFALMNSSTQQSVKSKRLAAGLGLDYGPDFFGKYGFAGGAQRIESAFDAKGIYGGQRQADERLLFGRQDAYKAYSAAIGPGGLASVTAQIMNSKGAVNSAFNTSEAGSGAKIVDAETKLKTSIDALTTKALPAVVDALGVVTVAMDAVSGWGDKTNKNPAGGTPWDTLGHFLSPGDAGFGNLSKAQDEAARGTKGTGWGAVVGNFFDQLATFTHLMSPATRSTQSQPARAIVRQAGNGLEGAGSFGSLLYGTNTGGVGRFNAGQSGSGAGKFGGSSGLYGAAFQAEYGPGTNAGTNNVEGQLALKIKNAINAGASSSALVSLLGSYKSTVFGDKSLTNAAAQAKYNTEEKAVEKTLGYRSNVAKQAPFHATNPGMGGLEAGYQNTAARFGGNIDPQAAEIALLRKELATANALNTRLLQQIATNTSTRLSPVEAPNQKHAAFEGTGWSRSGNR